MPPNKRLKLSGAIALKESECCALTGTNYRSTSSALAGSPPQLKRDPLGSAIEPRATLIELPKDPLSAIPNEEHEEDSEGSVCH